MSWRWKSFACRKHFPREEVYSLTDQIRRSSRSVAANIAEGISEEAVPNMFVNKLTDSDGEATRLKFGSTSHRDCGYMSKTNRDRLTAGYEQVGKMLSGMMKPIAIRTSVTSAAFCVLPSAVCRLPSAFCRLPPAVASLCLTCRGDSTAPYPSLLHRHIPRSLPTGMPIARRVTRTPRGFSKRLM